jgi:hypothetical protein
MIGCGMGTTDRSTAACLVSPEGHAALRSLNPIERMMFTRLIARQFALRPNIRAEIARYGIEGTVRYCSGRAMSIGIIPLMLIAVAFGVGGIGYVAAPAYTLAIVVIVLGLARFRSAARSAKRWRQEHQA